jgi:hypothetical protein
LTKVNSNLQIFFEFRYLVLKPSPTPMRLVVILQIRGAITHLMGGSGVAVAQGLSLAQLSLQLLQCFHGLLQVKKDDEESRQRSEP